MEDRPGMNAVQVRVSTGGASSTFKVRINGQESNAVAAARCHGGFGDFARTNVTRRANCLV
jgi:hypothetical protein